MFKALHALAQNATLMIVVSVEGEQLRLSITPTQTGDKKAAPALRPLSVIASPEEFDADFAAALAIWQAPKQSLIEQAKSAAGEDDEDPVETQSSKSSSTAAKGKPGRPRKIPAEPPAAATIDSTEKTAEQVMPAPVSTTGAPASTVDATDTLTLDLF